MRVPTHVCRSCGSMWKHYLPTDEEYGEAWSLCSGDGCGSCDNTHMGEQMRSVEWMDLFAVSPSFHEHFRKILNVKVRDGESGPHATK